MERKIFISYSWKDKQDIDYLDTVFARFQIPLTRDARDLKYDADIHYFMDSIREHDALIVYVSDAYLKSINCMYEATQVLGVPEKAVILLKKGTHLFTAEDKSKYIEYWEKQYQDIREKDPLLFEQELSDTKMARESIGPFIDFIKNKKRMNEETLDFDSLFDFLQIKKCYPDIITKTALDWIAENPQAKLSHLSALVNDLYRSKYICFSEFPDIPDQEKTYIFDKMQFADDINGISLLLSVTDKKTGSSKIMTYAHMVCIEENTIRSKRHAKYYFYCENPSRKQRYQEICSLENLKTLTAEENCILSIGYLDVYRLTVQF